MPNQNVTSALIRPNALDQNQQPQRVRITLMHVLLLGNVFLATNKKTGNGEHILEDDIYEWCRIDEGRVE